ncbi:Asp-tRNA(Asn)/Glu-tRNA(Gln) amidotransferase subunit GatC [Leucobacter ruminantium]|uniref:Aspartyl/glutamyl-tRNA(Asn/Gln) amidotransferase subunit C n=1 Tax=Leucobacter ruminantium TaxID=1289170 RepID=A0A939LWJ1_9MICO|nr:Asp-tRNA(Asn)/Glu-tRNA(Gln) amidotransferase subunit GatC [Leucobacter ruminantium]MBO1806089.1 Asp-tRNA(Asn)/Glu-tRNA(Gln) amidotransferase subunit GatC [Leucobacter ruminantium]
MPETTAAAAGTGTSSEITADTVQHLAGLSRIALTDAEVESLTSELGSILTNIAKVSEVATADVPATSHPIPINNVTRPDEIADVLTREEALANAPEAADGMFRVSSILGEEQ